MRRQATLFDLGDEEPMPAGASGRAPELLAAPLAAGLPAEVAHEVRRLLTAALLADLKAYPILPEEVTEIRVIAVGGYNRTEDEEIMNLQGERLPKKGEGGTQRPLFDVRAACHQKGRATAE